MIEWRSIKKDDRFWPEIPLVLDVEATLPIIYSAVGNSVGCYVFTKYIYKNGKWIEEGLPPKFGERATNLLVRGNREKLSFINLEVKRKQNSDVRAQNFKQVGPVHPYCR